MVTQPRVVLRLAEDDAVAVLERRTRVNLLARGALTCFAIALIAVGIAVSGDWSRALGAAAALIVLVPLFWLLHHPRRRRRRLRAVTAHE